MITINNWADSLKEFANNWLSHRLVEFHEVDTDGHCLECEQGLDDYHTRECTYAGCSLCGREDCSCDG